MDRVLGVVDHHEVDPARLVAGEGADLGAPGDRRQHRVDDSLYRHLHPLLLGMVGTHQRLADQRPFGCSRGDLADQHPLLLRALGEALFRQRQPVLDGEVGEGGLDAEDLQGPAAGRPEVLHHRLDLGLPPGDDPVLRVQGAHRHPRSHLGLDGEADLGVGRVVGVDGHPLGDRPFEVRRLHRGLDLAGGAGGDLAIELHHRAAARRLHLRDGGHPPRPRCAPRRCARSPCPVVPLRRPRSGRRRPPAARASGLRRQRRPGSRRWRGGTKRLRRIMGFSGRERGLDGVSRPSAAANPDRFPDHRGRLPHRHRRHRNGASRLPSAGPRAPRARLGRSPSTHR